MRVFPFIAIAILAACGEMTAVAEGENVRVERDGDDLTITNRRDEVIYFFAVPEKWLHVIDWAPCTAEPWCPRVLPDETGHHVLPPGTEKDDLVLFYWWHAIEGEEGPIAGEIRLLEID